MISSPTNAAPPNPIVVLVADSNQMQSQLLVDALQKCPEFQVVSSSMNLDEVLNAMSCFPVRVALLNGDKSSHAGRDMTIVRQFHIAHPAIPLVLLLHDYDRDLVVKAFRSGVKGLFCFSDYSFQLLCKCIQSVYQGQVWANSEQLHYLLQVVTQVPSLRMVNANGIKLLTPREEQVVALVADGLSNREVASELSLSEHTVKKYMFRIFDKLGIFSRVELVLYAVAHGGHREAEWIAGGAA
ncbi:MAG: response regulator transcription factor [Acidobacteriota bacterium]|jgi:two-component system nitrate/nitrite response regulator NarL|nr:response regulator transcription factor [Acidobacteriota bacterium]